MTSRRRAARAGLNRAQDAPEGLPEWLWGFSYARWVAAVQEAGGDASLEAAIRARRKWREARDAWLEERGLVMWGMRGLTCGEFKRIEQEEPHRVLHRPKTAGA